MSPGNMQLPVRLGKYELIEFLGGGMSHVFRAKDTVIGRTVAVKILTPEGCADTETKERFLLEARMAGNISHENVISIYDFGELEGRPFLVMEFLHGDSLRSLIKAGGTGDLTAKLKLARQIARALEYIHSQSIIHRDIKPDNVHVNEKGVVKLIDFGIAKTEGLSRTRAGFVLGTPYYMAPEQVKGEQLTPLVDVYAFGILLFELLAGVKPFKAESIEQIFHAVLNQPVDLTPLEQAGIPQPVNDLVRRCVAKNSADRPQGFAVISAELDRLIAPEIPPERSVASAPVKTPNRLWPMVIALAVLLVLIGAGYAIWNRSRATTPAPLAETLSTPVGDMILIPAGSFLSGADKRSVTLPDYYIDRTEVTNDAYQRYCTERGRPLPEGFPADKPGFPVTNITLDDARDFAKWAGKRLPTMPEWEKAARGTDGRLYPWGNDADASAANLGSVMDHPWSTDRYARDRSPFGALNMGGNASEYVDQIQTPSEGAIRRFATLVTPPPTAGEPWYTFRGGSYRLPIASATTYEWGSLPARFRGPDLGFRCVKDPPRK